MRNLAGTLLAVVGLWLGYTAVTGQSARDELLALFGGGPGSTFRAGKKAPTFSTAIYGKGAPGIGKGTPGPSSPGGALDAQAVARLVIAAGITNPEAVAIAVAIAHRESRFDPAAHNPVPPDDSYGLWQINRLAHPQHSPAQLVDPAYNARVMAQLSARGTNWRPWRTATATPPAGLTYLPEARAAVAALGVAR